MVVNTETGENFREEIPLISITDLNHRGQIRRRGKVYKYKLKLTRMMHKFLEVLCTFHAFSYYYQNPAAMQILVSFEKNRSVQSKFFLYRTASSGIDMAISARPLYKSIQTKIIKSCTRQSASCGHRLKCPASSQFSAKKIRSFLRPRALMLTWLIFRLMGETLLT